MNVSRDSSGKASWMTYHQPAGEPGDKMCEGAIFITPTATGQSFLLDQIFFDIKTAQGRLGVQIKSNGFCATFSEEREINQILDSLKDKKIRSICQASYFFLLEIKKTRDLFVPFQNQLQKNNDPKSQNLVSYLNENYQAYQQAPPVVARKRIIQSHNIEVFIYEKRSPKDIEGMSPGNVHQYLMSTTTTRIANQGFTFWDSGLIQTNRVNQIICRNTRKIKGTFHLNIECANDLCLLAIRVKEIKKQAYTLITRFLQSQKQQPVAAITSLSLLEPSQPPQPQAQEVTYAKIPPPSHQGQEFIVSTSSPSPPLLQSFAQPSPQPSQSSQPQAQIQEMTHEKVPLRSHQGQAFIVSTYSPSPPLLQSSVQSSSAIPSQPSEQQSSPQLSEESPSFQSCEQQIEKKEEVNYSEVPYAEFPLSPDPAFVASIRHSQKEDPIQYVTLGRQHASLPACLKIEQTSSGYTPLALFVRHKYLNSLIHQEKIFSTIEGGRPISIFGNIKKDTGFCFAGGSGFELDVQISNYCNDRQTFGINCFFNQAILQKIVSLASITNLFKLNLSQQKSFQTPIQSFLHHLDALISQKEENDLVDVYFYQTPCEPQSPISYELTGIIPGLGGYSLILTSDQTTILKHLDKKSRITPPPSHLKIPTTMSQATYLVNLAREIQELQQQTSKISQACYLKRRLESQQRAKRLSVQQNSFIPLSPSPSLSPVTTSHSQHLLSYSPTPLLPRPSHPLLPSPSNTITSYPPQLAATTFIPYPPPPVPYPPPPKAITSYQPQLPATTFIPYPPPPHPEPLSLIDQQHLWQIVISSHLNDSPFG